MDIKTKIKSILENINYTLLSNLCHHYVLKIYIEEEFHELNLNLSSEINFRLFENEEPIRLFSCARRRRYSRHV